MQSERIKIREFDNMAIEFARDTNCIEELLRGHLLVWDYSQNEKDAYGTKLRPWEVDFFRFSAIYNLKTLLDNMKICDLNLRNRAEEIVGTGFSEAADYFRTIYHVPSAHLSLKADRIRF